jgi:hypothetical protein
VDLLIFVVILGFIGGTGLLVGGATGFARGRLGLPRWRAILMACLYTFLIFPTACVGVMALLFFSGVYRVAEFSPAELGTVMLVFLLGGVVAALPAAVAAFFAHVLSWNRHHARKLGTPQA